MKDPGSRCNAGRLTSAARPTINLRIEELVLHGFTPAGRYHLADALVRELQRLFAGQPIPESITKDVEVSHIDAGTFQAARGLESEAIGEQVARAVYRGFNK